VATSIGAEGYPLVHGKQILIGDLDRTPELIFMILKDEALRSKLALQGETFASQYDWDLLLRKIEKIFIEATCNR
jgi:glycosyltransferase involved in cell wall biosynthesis